METPQIYGTIRSFCVGNNVLHLALKTSSETCLQTSQCRDQWEAAYEEGGGCSQSQALALVLFSLKLGYLVRTAVRGPCPLLGQSQGPMPVTTVLQCLSFGVAALLLPLFASWRECLHSRGPVPGQYCCVVLCGAGLCLACGRAHASSTCVPDPFALWFPFVPGLPDNTFCFIPCSCLLVLKGSICHPPIASQFYSYSTVRSFWVGFSGVGGGESAIFLLFFNQCQLIIVTVLFHMCGIVSWGFLFPLLKGKYVCWRTNFSFSGSYRSVFLK